MFITILIIFQVLVMCFQTYALGYSKCKLPKCLLFANIFILIFNFVMLVSNINKV